MRTSVTIHLLCFSILLAASAQGGEHKSCDRVYLEPSSGRAWIAPTEIAAQFLESQGFKRAEGTPGRIPAGVRLANANPCSEAGKRPVNPGMYVGVDHRFTFVADTACGTHWAREWRLRPYSPAEENYGSMEAGILIPSSMLEACASPKRQGRRNP